MFLSFFWMSSTMLQPFFSFEKEYICVRISYYCSCFPEFQCQYIDIVILLCKSKNKVIILDLKRQINRQYTRNIFEWILFNRTRQSILFPLFCPVIWNFIDFRAKIWLNSNMFDTDNKYQFDYLKAVVLLKGKTHKKVVSFIFFRMKFSFHILWTDCVRSTDFFFVETSHFDYEKWYLLYSHQQVGIEYYTHLMEYSENFYILKVDFAELLLLLLFVISYLACSQSMC